MIEDDAILRAKLNADTGQLEWRELERHFARGVVIRVAAGVDLLEVALAMARDDAATLRAWLADGRVAQAGAAEASLWHAGGSRFWAVVVAPWVLVQEVAGHPSHRPN